MWNKLGYINTSSSLIFYFFTKKIKKHIYISLIIKILIKNTTNLQLIDYQTNKVFQRTIVNTILYSFVNYYDNYK